MDARLVEISCDDGNKLDFKLIGLLKKYNLPCTFYIAPLNTGLTETQIKIISNEYEIGGHTLTHAILNDLDDDTIRDEVVIGKECLEKIIDKPITKFCYPRGRYTERVKAIVKEAGFTQARTTKIKCTTIPEDPFEYHTTVHAFQNPKYDEEHWVSAALRMWDSKPEYFHIWLHSKEVDKHNQWANLEYLFQKITE